MWRLIAARHTSQDRGAVAVLVVILLSVFLLGLGAIAVDAGSWYSEKAQVQNGADAGALAVAQSCGKGACDVTRALPQALGSTNGTNDTTAQVVKVCGNASGSAPGLSPCSFDAVETDICPPLPSSGAYVYVHTKTLNTKTGTSLVPPMMGRVLVGSSYDGKEVNACAQASWGAPAGLGNAVAFTISYCEWQHDVASDGTFASYPPWPPSFLDVRSGAAPAAKAEHVLVLHGDQGSTSCNAGNDSAGWDAPGAFGWVGDGSTCSVSIINNTYAANTGGNAINACASTFQTAYSNHKPIFIPIYDGTTGTGNNVSYTLKGFAAFVLTGWDLTSGQSGWKGAGGTIKEPSLIALSEGETPANYCSTPLVASNSDVCVYGFFTQALIPADALPTGSGSPLGATGVQLTG